MMDYIFQGFEKFFNWVISIVSPMVNPLLAPVADRIPDLSLEATEIIQFLGFVNYWFPLDFGIGLLTAYYVILFIFIAVRTIFKFIPFVG